MSAHEPGIVVGVDGSHNALVAAGWAAHEAERRKLSMKMILAINEPLPGHSDYVFPPPVIAAVRAASRERLDQAVMAIRHHHPDLRVAATLEHIDPRRALVIASSDAILTVVGTRGMGRVPEVLLGSVSLYVAAHAHSPVVVVPSTTVADSAAPTGPILVGVDETASSTAAVGAAFGEAAVRMTELFAVLVFDDLAYRGFAKGASLIGRLADDEENAVLAEQLAGWRDKYPDVPVHHLVVRGRPAATLLNYTQHQSHVPRPQLIVVGSRGRGGTTGLLLGSTSQYLISHADIPVMIVPTPTDERIRIEWP